MAHKREILWKKVLDAFHEFETEIPNDRKVRKAYANIHLVCADFCQSMMDWHLKQMEPINDKSNV